MKPSEEKEIRLKLMRELKKIYDNKDFVCGSVAIAKTVDNWNYILDFIQTAARLGEPITSDEIQLLALSLRKETDSKSKVLSTKRSVAVAVF